MPTGSVELRPPALRHDALDEAPLDRPHHEVAVCLEAVGGLKVVGLREALSVAKPPSETRAPSRQPELQRHDVLRKHVPGEVACTPTS